MKSSRLLITLGMLPFAAYAEVSLYGIVQGTLSQHSQTDAASNSTLSDSGSRVGIKGTETMSGGQKLLWQVESKLHLDGHEDNAKSGFGTRETFIGLEDTDFGTLRIGYLNGALRDLYTVDQWQYASHINNPLVKGEPHPSIGVNGLNLLTRHGRRLKNVVRYDFPSVNGFGATLAYSFGENASKGSGNNGKTPASDIFSAGLNYQYGPGFIRYAYEREGNPMGIALDAKDNKKYSADKAHTGDTVTPADIHYIEAGYKSEALFVGLGIQQAVGYDWTDGHSGSSATNFGSGSTLRSAAQARVKTRQAVLSAAYTIGMLTPKLSLARGWDKHVDGVRVSRSGYRQWVAGIDYQLSKRTSTGLSYGRLNLDHGAIAAFDKATTLASLGLNFKHSF